MAPVDRVGVPGAGLVSRATQRACMEGPGQVLQGQVYGWEGSRACSFPDCREGPEGSLDAIWSLAAVARQLLKREARY